MGSNITTITSRWQVTIPAEVRNDFLLKVGPRIVWEVDGDKLVGRRLRAKGEDLNLTMAYLPLWL